MRFKNKLEIATHICLFGKTNSADKKIRLYPILEVNWVTEKVYFEFAGHTSHSPFNTVETMDTLYWRSWANK